jgi:hypothetical protein
MPQLHKHLNVVSNLFWTHTNYLKHILIMSKLFREKPVLSFIENGNIYTFDVHDLDDELPKMSAIFIFTERVETEVESFSHKYVLTDFISNLQAIPKETYELAKSKGANSICTTKWAVNNHEREYGVSDIIKAFGDE